MTGQESERAATRITEKILKLPGCESANPQAVKAAVLSELSGESTDRKPATNGWATIGGVKAKMGGTQG